MNFGKIKPFEAQGEFGNESLIVRYASILPTDTLPLRMRNSASSEKFSSERAHLEKQSSGSRFMQLKAAELIGNIRKAGSNSQALYMQLAGMSDELAGARYARFINKRFSELGAERFEKILEESRDLGAGWEL